MKFQVVLSFVIHITLCNSMCYREILTLQGAVRGWNTDDPHIFSFYGIPYANVPKGVDKFKAPLPPSNWKGVLNATDRSVVCPQPRTTARIGLKTSLDCLKLNIYMPGLESENLPVYVYIHGGSFRTGHGTLYRPIDLARRGIVVVNFNYRLGPYGFLCLNTEFAPGNAGLKDQVAALKWVQSNIVYFGGDAKKITVGGSDAGASSTELLMISPVSAPLFAKGLCESGSAIASLTSMPLEIAKNHAFYFSPKSSISPQILEQIYRSIDDADLNIDYKGNDIAINTGFLPCIENHNISGVDKIITERPLTTLVKGNFRRKPYLTGFATNEGSDLLFKYEPLKEYLNNNFSLFLPSSINSTSPSQKEQTAKKLKAFYFFKNKQSLEATTTGYLMYTSDAFFRYPVMLSARLHTLRNDFSVYLYFFKYDGCVKMPRAITPPDVQGPGHMFQSLYVHELREPISRRFTDDDRMIQDRLREMWANFIRFSDPIPQTTQFLPVKWTPVKNQSCNYMIIDRVFVMNKLPLKDTVYLWDGIYGIKLADAGWFPVKTTLALATAAAGAGILYAMRK